ncbi:ABC transporter substrate-binding protein [Pigmentibacter sp. JX0631]|uniref:ABC transporter substrate-binding protein n=1 Tax=Pigmentibacter sp. JX0631 TaxID=2976982 RepID=UPI002468A88C|nr:ABC transporter substrate-binding protein [Pigmentibacter sp. JX0631]WGL59613.1 ABC transporter substrate-binding protein [Pigmentibacter sp. JX0631]
MNKKSILLISSLIIILLAVVLMNRMKQNPDEITIGILQFASFPALDEARIGFMEQTKKELGNNIKFIEQNAQGSVVQAQAIASSFKANQNIKAFYAIATPSVMALKAEIKDRPIIFAAVTDPVGLNLNSPETNITGATDMADIAEQIEILRSLLPNINKIAILYNPAESNSTIQVKKMKEELFKYNIKALDVGANSQADVAAAVQNATQNAQAVLVPTDNTISSAFPIVRQIADKAKIPLITTGTNEKDPPLMQFGVDYTQSGIQAANLLRSILLEGKKPAELEFISPSSKIYINSLELKKYNVILPENIKNSVTLL